MKLLKSSILAALAFAVTLTGCSDDDNYSIGAASPGAYFPTTNETSVKALTTTSVYEVPVCRTSSSDPETYNVTAHVYPETTGISIPTTVSFVGDALQASLPITYDAAVAGVGTVYDIVLTLDNSSSYGNATQEMTFTIAAPTQTVPWDGSVPEGTDAAGNVYPAVEGSCTGTGTYLYNACQLGTDPGLKINKVYDPENPHTYDLVVEQWGYNVPFTISVPDDRVRNEYGEVVVRVFPNSFGGDLISELTGADDGTYGLTYVADYQYYAPLIGDTGDYSGYSSYNPETGVITMLVAYYCSQGYVALDYDYFNLDGYPDYTVSAEYKGLYTNTAGEVFAIGTFTAGSDVASVKAAIVSTTDQQTALNYVLADGDDVQTITPGSDMRGLFSVTKSGSYIIAAVSYDSAGEAQNAAFATARIDLSSAEDDSDDWKVLGTGQLVDGWFLTAFGVDPTSYPVDVTFRQSKTDATKYQMVAPYAASSNILVAEGINQCTTKRNIEFTLNGDYVEILPQLSGFLYSRISSEEFKLMNYEGYLAALAAQEEVELTPADIQASLNEYGMPLSAYDSEEQMIEIPDSPFCLGSELTIRSWSNGGQAVTENSYICFPETSAAARHKVRAKMVAAPKVSGLSKSIKAKMVEQKVIKGFIRTTPGKAHRRTIVRK